MTTKEKAVTSPADELNAKIREVMAEVGKVVAVATEELRAQLRAAFPPVSAPVSTEDTDHSPEWLMAQSARRYKHERDVLSGEVDNLRAEVERLRGDLNQAHTYIGERLFAELLAAPVSSVEPEASHLAVTTSDRGFDAMPSIPSTYGGEVRVYESSAASGPHIWLSATAPESLNDPNGPQIEATLHLTAENAGRLGDQLHTLVRDHYQSSVEPEQPTAEEFAAFNAAIKTHREPAVPEQAQPLRRWLDKFGQTWQDIPDGHSMEMLHDENGDPPPESIVISRSTVEYQNGPLVEVVEAPTGQDGQR